MNFRRCRRVHIIMNFITGLVSTLSIHILYLSNTGISSRTVWLSVFVFQFPLMEGLLQSQQWLHLYWIKWLDADFPLYLLLGKELYWLPNSSVKVTNFEYMDIMFGLHIILNCDILSWYSHHTCNILWRSLCTLFMNIIANCTDEHCFLLLKCSLSVISLLLFAVLCWLQIKHFIYF